MCCCFCPCCRLVWAAESCTEFAWSSWDASGCPPCVDTTKPWEVQTRNRTYIVSAGGARDCMIALETAACNVPQCGTSRGGAAPACVVMAGMLGPAVCRGVDVASGGTVGCTACFYPEGGTSLVLVRVWLWVWVCPGLCMLCV